MREDSPRTSTRIRLVIGVLSLLVIAQLGVIYVLLKPVMEGTSQVGLFSQERKQGNYVATFSKQDRPRWKKVKGNQILSGQGYKNGWESAVLTSRLKSAFSWGRTQGIFLQLPDNYEKKFSGKRIVVTVIARKPAKSPTNNFRVAYSTNEVGNSGWRKFKLNDNFTAHRFEYNVPKIKMGKGDFLGIWADPTGSGKGVEVASVVIKTKSPQKKLR